MAVELEQTRSCNGEKCGGNIYNTGFASNTNNMFNARDYDQEEQDPNENIFKQTKFERKSFKPAYENGLSFSEDTDIAKNARLNRINEPRFNAFENEQVVDTLNNVYGQEKLVSKTRDSYSGEQNQNLFGEVTLQRGQRKKQQFSSPSRRMDELTYGNRNLYNSRQTGSSNTNVASGGSQYGFRTIDADEDKSNSFCLQKPIGSQEKCDKKRLIVLNYWFYDADDGECKIFTADNCDENKNKFFSMEKCLATCSHVVKEDQIGEEEIINARPGYNRGFDTTPRAPYRSRWN